MTMQAPHSQFQNAGHSRQRDGILSKLGLVRPEASGTTYQQSLDQIGVFLDHYGLLLNPQTLSIAYDCITEARGNLRQKLDFEIEKNGRISGEWLAELSPEQNDERQDGATKRLAEALESNIVEFNSTVEAAQCATHNYGSRLREKSDRISNDNADDDMPSIVELLHGIVAETIDLEQEIRKAREETRRLQDDLERTKQMAEQDYLTGLLNRRSIDKAIATEVELARTQGQSFVIAMCDLDNFKQINDHHGHETGDRLLKLVSSALSQLSSDRCHIGRFGGDEFVLVFRGLAVQSAAAQLDRVRVRLQSRKLVDKDTGQSIGQISFSAGLAGLNDGMRVAEVMDAADQALYEAKRMGRNRVVTS